MGYASKPMSIWYATGPTCYKWTCNGRGEAVDLALELVDQAGLGLLHNGHHQGDSSHLRLHGGVRTVHARLPG